MLALSDNLTANRIRQKSLPLGSPVGFYVLAVTVAYVVQCELATLLENVEELPPDATLLTPLSRKPFRIEDVQEPRILISYREDDETIPLDREQFETLFQRIDEARHEFELDRLPPGAEPYATVISLHPRFELDDREGTIVERDTPTGSPLVDAYEIDHETDNREAPDISVV